MKKEAKIEADPIEVRHIFDWTSTLNQDDFTTNDILQLMLSNSYERWLESLAFGLLESQDEGALWVGDEDLHGIDL